MTLEILYEDNHLIAVNKPAGVLVQGDKTGDATLMDEVKYYLKNKYHKPGKVFLGLIHRLDRPVAGIILFAKTTKGASRLSEQFREHTVEKIYHALVAGKPPEPAATVHHFLVKDENKNKTTVYSTFVPGSVTAELSYQTIKNNSGNTLLKIKLGTGRSHQIRAQLAAIGCPIVGDVKYGAPAIGDTQRLFLAATSLKFTTATTGEEILIETKIPADWQV